MGNTEGTDRSNGERFPLGYRRGLVQTTSSIGTGYERLGERCNEGQTKILYLD